MISKEEKFKELIDGYHIELSIDRFPNRIFFRKSKKDYIIEHHKNFSYSEVNYFTIWKIFKENYNMEYTDIQRFLNEMIEKYIGIKGTNPVTVYALNDI